MRELAAAVGLGFNGGDADKVFPLKHGGDRRPLPTEGWDTEKWWQAGTGDGYGEGTEAN